MKFSGGNLETLKTILQREVDELAEAERAQYITLGAGQALVYEQKLREAELVLADVNTPAAEVPNLAVEAQDLDISLYDAAVVVVTNAYEWANMSAVIEQKRLSTKRSIRAAVTASEARAARDQYE